MLTYIRRTARTMTYGAFILFGFLAMAVIAAPQVSANDLPVEYPSSVSGNETWEGGKVYMITSSVSVANGATLTIEPGAVIKNYSWGIQVDEGGALNAIGTANEPIVFTSYGDDSVGGDSNSNGPSTGGILDYYEAIKFNGGSGVLSNAIVKSAYTGINVSCSLGSGIISITDNTIESTTSVGNCNPDRLVLKRNSFNVLNRSLTVGSSDPSFVVLAGQDKNTFSGTAYGRAIVIGNATLPVGKTWTIDTVASGASAVYSEYSALTVAGTLNLSPGSVFKASVYGTGIIIQDGGTVNMAGTSTARTVLTDIKDDSTGGDVNGDGPSSAGSWMDYFVGIEVADGGSLNATHALFKYGGQGVKALGGSLDLADVEFTGDMLQILGDTEATLSDVAIHSYYDGIYIDGQPTVTIDGLQISGIANTAIVVYGSAKVVIHDASVSDANNGLSVSGVAQVSYRGSFDDITDKAVRACNWGQGCFVDAAYTDWGSVDGPYHDFSHPLVCGYVFIYPWVHMEEEYTNARWASNCDGTKGPDELLDDAIANFQDRVNQKGIDCTNGFQDACQAIQTAMTCLAGAVNVASATSPLPLPEVNEQWQIQPFQEAVKEEAKGKMIEWALEILLPDDLAAAAGKALGLVDLHSTLSDAYNSCAPN